MLNSFFYIITKCFGGKDPYNLTDPGPPLPLRWKFRNRLAHAYCRTQDWCFCSLVFYYLPMCRASFSAFKSKALWLISRQSFYALLTLPSLLTISPLYSPDTHQWLALGTKGQEKLSLLPNIEALTMWTFSTFWWTSHVHSTISYVWNMNGFDCTCDIFDYWNARTPHWCWLATKSLVLFSERDAEVSLGPWRCLLSCGTVNQEGERPSHTNLRQSVSVKLTTNMSSSFLKQLSSISAIPT